MADESPDGWPVVLRFPLHWGEMDALGHVNNTCYLRWFESARIETFRRVGRIAVNAPRGLGPILATTTCDYLRPIVWPAEIVVGARVTKVGTTSVTMAYAVWRADEPAPCARGTSVIVLVDYGTGAKVPVPDDLRERLSALA
jgi:acyl-CoA thioester hydrolase